MGFVIEFLVTHVFSYRSSHAGERRAKRVNKIQSDDSFMDLADEEYRKMGSLPNLATHRQFLTFQEIHKAQINDPISSTITDQILNSTMMRSTERLPSSYQ